MKFLSDLNRIQVAVQKSYVFASKTFLDLLSEYFFAPGDPFLIPSGEISNTREISRQDPKIEKKFLEKIQKINKKNSKFFLIQKFYFAKIKKKIENLKSATLTLTPSIIVDNLLPPCPSGESKVGIVQKSKFSNQRLEPPFLPSPITSTSKRILESSRSLLLRNGFQTFDTSRVPCSRQNENYSRLEVFYLFRGPQNIQKIKSKNRF